MNSDLIPEIFSTPDFGNFKLSVFINKPLLSGILLVYFIVYVSLGGILFYHWRKYGMRSSSVIFAETAFLFVSLILFVLAGVAISYY